MYVVKLFKQKILRKCKFINKLKSNQGRPGEEELNKCNIEKKIFF